MVTVRLSDNSSIRRLYINPKQEITREEGVAVPVKWAAIRLSDPNYFFVFGEEDKDELLELNERFLQVFSTEMGKEILSGKKLLEELLPAPKKTILPKPSLKKTKAQTKPKTSLKK
jgi:hypothetical protein